jgi:thioredoxin 1
MFVPGKLNILLPLAIIVMSVFVGCDASRVPKNLDEAPDGAVERLVVSETGSVDAVAGKFLELVKRTDQKLVLVDFWAPWCGPCKMLSPSLQQIKKDWGDRIEIVKVNTDEAGALVGYFEINGIPDVRVFRAGAQVADFQGAAPRQEIEAMLKSLE